MRLPYPIEQTELMHAGLMEAGMSHTWDEINQIIFDFLETD
jgi:hypothetical protein